MENKEVNHHALHNFVFIGSNGKMRGLEITENVVRTVWVAELEGSVKHMVHLILNEKRGHLYVATHGYVLNLDALTGYTIWKVRPEIQKGLVTAELMTLLLTMDKSTIVSSSNNSITALHTTGIILWKVNFDGNIRSHTYVMLEYDGLIFVGNEGNVYAFSLINGEIKWKKDLTGYGSHNPITLASHSYNNNIGGVNTVLFVGINGHILVYNIHTGERHYHVTPEGLMGSRPVALLVDSSSNILLVAISGELRCYNPNNMRVIWKSDLPGMGYSDSHSLLLHNDQVLIGMQGKVAAVNKSTGKIEWKKDLSVGASHLVTLARMANSNIICASGGIIYALDNYGTRLWKDALPGMGFGNICVSTSAINTDFNSTTLPHKIEVERKVNFF